MSQYDPAETGQVSAAEMQYQTLINLFAAYARESAALYANQNVGMGETIKRYLNMDDVRNSPIHKKFYLDLQACVQALSEELARSPSPALARAAAEPFFRKKEKDMEPCERSWLIAAEALVIPLLPYLEQADAAGFCDSYEAQYRWEEMMPTQRELYNALCERAGRKKRKIGFFESLFSSVPKKS